MPPALRSAARSDVGLVRSSNQDSGYAGDRFLVVADGMGGHAGGDVASSVAVSELIALDDEAHGADAPEQLRRAVARAQRALLEQVRVRPELAGMGTTVTALLRSGERLVLAHLGDSRGYLLHEGELVQVTRDHTFVQRLVDDGRITPEEAERHPQRNVILRVLGDVQSSPEPDVSVRTAVVGDRWLLCSDGLPRVVSDETIADTLVAEADPATCAEALVQLALRAGAPDNVTCIVADVVAEETLHSGSAQVVGSVAQHRPARTAALASPAARAAALARAQPDDDEGGGEDDEPDPARRRRTWVRRAVVAVVVVVVLAGGVAAATTWLHRQFYVGASGDRVAVYRGVSTSVGPVSLHTVVEVEPLRLASLPAAYRARVRAGIPVDDLAGAQRTVASLRQASSDGSGAAGGSGGAGSTPSPSPSTSASSGAPSASPSAAPSASAPAAPVPTPTTAAP